MNTPDGLKSCCAIGLACRAMAWACQAGRAMTRCSTATACAIACRAWLVRENRGLRKQVGWLPASCCVSPAKRGSASSCARNAADSASGKGKPRFSVSARFMAKHQQPLQAASFTSQAAP